MNCGQSPNRRTHLAKARRRSGEISALEVELAREPVIDADRLILDTEQQQELAVLALARLLGRLASDLRDLVGPGEPAHAALPPTDDLLQVAYHRRLEALFAELQVLAADAAVDQERANRLQELRLGWSWERVVQSIRGFTTMLSLPLFDRDQAQIAAAIARAEEARAEQRRVRQQIEFEVQQSVTQVVLARARLDLLSDVAVPYADDLASRVALRKEGGDDVVELAQSVRRMQVRRNRDLVQARVDVEVALAGLEMALGCRLQPTSPPANSLDHPTTRSPAPALGASKP